MNDSATAFAAIALGAGDGRDRALDHLEATLAPDRSARRADVPLDASVHGWAWTESTFGWVDPTARAVLALRLLRPGAPAIEDGVGMLRDRETVGGGWNYGNRVVFGEDLWPYAQTTARALVALQGADPDAGATRSLDAPPAVARRSATAGCRWRCRPPRSVSTGTTTRTHPSARCSIVFDRTAFMGDVVTLAWSAIATGPSLARLEVAT